MGAHARSHLGTWDRHCMAGAFVTLATTGGERGKRQRAGTSLETSLISGRCRHETVSSCSQRAERSSGADQSTFLGSRLDGYQDVVVHGYDRANHGRSVCLRMQRRFSTPSRFGREATADPKQTDAADRFQSLIEQVQLVCPECRTPLKLRRKNLVSCPRGHGEAALETTSLSGGDEGGGFVDLTPERFRRGMKLTVRGPVLEMRRDLFQSPFVAYLYERGWRDQFRASGFPGPDAEYHLVQSFFEGARCVMDVSCGSGLFTRRLAASGKFDQIIAVDYSEAMLRETLERAKRERLPEALGGGPVSDRITAVIRADVERLPFADESIDCIHAGAALHCWPRVQDGLHEVYRVLRPSQGPGTGRFLATTFLWSWTPFGFWIREGRLLDFQSGYRFFDAKELEWLLKSAGFERVEVEVIRQCAIIRAWKEPRQA
ncbi:hypothetical protein F1559_003537 [Cyanidiococcus yangmingshanensis]|uniref:Methyltransferase type 11 domain-containing protein n=1 Tax=Cyanidiococcus yangmingshanensis TaxID=2690220 RepID=A0A7J7IM59_9RHOD|nr:hypothetical protein F1559_003537 [Cyanidiococcus yangmingshanensis]